MHTFAYKAQLNCKTFAQSFSLKKKKKKLWFTHHGAVVFFAKNVWGECCKEVYIFSAIKYVFIDCVGETESTFEFYQADFLSKERQLV